MKLGNELVRTDQQEENPLITGQQPTCLWSIPTGHVPGYFLGRGNQSLYTLISKDGKNLFIAWTLDMISGGG